MSDNVNSEKPTSIEGKRKEPIVILGRVLSDNAAEIYNDFSKEIKEPIEFEWTDEDNSSVLVYKQNKHYISISKDISRFEYSVLHECCHIIQLKEGYPCITIKNNTDMRIKKIINEIQNAVLDIDVGNRLKNKGFPIPSTDYKFNKYYPILNKSNNQAQKLFDEYLCKHLTVEIVAIRLFDSEWHFEKLLSCLDKMHPEIRKYAYAMLKCIENYSPGINKDNCSSLYLELIGALKFSNIGICMEYVTDLFHQEPSESLIGTQPEEK